MIGVGNERNTKPEINNILIATTSHHLRMLFPLISRRKSINNQTRLNRINPKISEIANSLYGEAL